MNKMDKEMFNEILRSQEGKPFDFYEVARQVVKVNAESRGNQLTEDEIEKEANRAIDLLLNS